MPMNKIMSADREAAEEINLVRWSGSPDTANSQFIKAAAQIIADARPEPSPDAETLARRIAEELQYWFQIEGPGLNLLKPEEWAKAVELKLLFLIQNFRPVTVDVEAAAEEIRYSIYNMSEDLNNVGDIEEIITRHLTDTPEPTRTQEEWDVEAECLADMLRIWAKIQEKSEEQGMADDLRRAADFLSPLPAPTGKEEAPMDTPKLEGDVEELVKRIKSHTNHSSHQADWYLSKELLEQATTTIEALSRVRLVKDVENMNVTISKNRILLADATDTIEVLSGKLAKAEARVKELYKQIDHLCDRGPYSDEN